MKLFRGFGQQGDASVFNQGTVATIGNFDGVHKGHQSIVKQVLAQSKKMGLPSLVIVFEPQPMEFFHPQKAPARLMRFREKYSYLESLGVDFLVCLPFSKKLSELSASTFVEEILCKQLVLRYLVVGDDFTFGRDRQGNYALLESMGERFGFSVEDSQSFVCGKSRVSSTLIRKYLAESDFLKASELLGRPFEFSGKVCYGQQLGRQLGVPTLNLSVSRKRSPIKGVFLSETIIEGDPTPYPSISNLGRRPTVNGTGTLLEVHLLDFDKTIYGKQVSVRPIQKVRDEQKFPSIELMKEQIVKDIRMAKNYFKLI